MCLCFAYMYVCALFTCIVQGGLKQTDIKCLLELWEVVTTMLVLGIKPQPIL